MDADSPEYGNFDLMFEFEFDSDDDLLSAIDLGDRETVFQDEDNGEHPVADKENVAPDPVATTREPSHPKPEAELTARRFARVSEEDLAEIEENRHSKATKKQTKFGVNLFREWLTETGRECNFEKKSPEDLDDSLRAFYASLRTSKGELYSKSTFVGIRAAINRHLRSLNRPFSILEDTVFTRSNNMFKSMLRKLKREGRDITQHHHPISQGDLVKLQTSGELSQDNPRSLQKKVWFDITLGFARRGCENLRNLKASSFTFKKDDTGKEYVEMTYNEATKNHQGDNLKDVSCSRTRMYSTGDGMCPVASLRKYLDKRDKENDILFQQPKSGKVTEADGRWYTSRPVGEKTLNRFMRNMSEKAKLSEIYTNHCVRATTITMLAHAGIEVREIMRISGHRNEQSVRSYNTDSSSEQKRHYSNILHGNVRPFNSTPFSVPQGPLHPSTNVNNGTVIATSTQSVPNHFEIHNSTVQVFNYLSK